MHRAALAALLTVAAFATACGRNAEPHTYDITAADLPESATLSCGDVEVDEDLDADVSSVDGGVAVGETCSWQSSTWNGKDWLSYPGAGTLRIHHPLGRVPASIIVYLSFEKTGEGAGQASGDLAHINDVTDEYVEITNATNADYYCRVVLQ